jgi:3-oxoacyl-[acyl-carrier protein] reductase
MDESRVWSAAQLRTGLQAQFERHITAEDVAAFAELSRDRNPLHVDEAYASETNYGARIVHGAFQVALASAMAGMYLPGREVVVGSFQCRFPAPLFYPSRVRVQGEITAWVPPTASGTLRVRVMELASSRTTAEIHVGFSLHERRSALSSPEAQPRSGGSAPDDGKPAVLVTGASGGIGRHLASVLSGSYHVIGLSRSGGGESAGGSVEWIGADLNAPEWELTVERELQGRRLHGLVHAAWPAGPEGSLLEVDACAVRTQLEFGALLTLRIAQFLRSHAGDGGRLIVLGSTAASIRPVLQMSAYSLGKAALEHTVRLLAPELARRNITINLVAPSFVPVGMNSSKTSRVILTETARVPLGKLCSPEDVARTVEFFLSPGAAFITGQTLALTGGVL